MALRMWTVRQGEGGDRRRKWCSRAHYSKITTTASTRTVAGEKLRKTASAAAATTTSTALTRAATLHACIVIIVALMCLFASVLQCGLRTQPRTYIHTYMQEQAPRLRTKMKMRAYKHTFINRWQLHESSAVLNTHTYKFI